MRMQGNKNVLFSVLWHGTKDLMKRWEMQSRYHKHVCTIGRLTRINSLQLGIFRYIEFIET